ncbi:MAG: AIM24 family protein [Oscillospiraceae bacterium]|nr:AIM24 family protein [Oscillospiraceae bacterium]
MNYEKKYGAPFPVIEITLNQGEQICIEPGTKVYSDPSLFLRTVRNSQRQRATGGKKIGMFSSANKLMTIVQSGATNSRIAVAPCVPGDVIELNCGNGEQWKMMAGSFLACDMGVNFEVVQSGWSGLISGGIPVCVLQTSGAGSCIVDSCGTLQKFNLNGNKVIDVDVHHLVAWSAGLQYHVSNQRERGLAWVQSTARFTGQGSVIVQSNCRISPALK